MSDCLIQAQGLNTFYGASHILRGINFSVGRGETIGLMGRNGMGKSTLLKTLMGIVPPRTGSVDIKGRRMNGRPTFEVAQMGIAYVPEGRGIFGNLSVLENLKMAARPGTQGQRDWTCERVLETFPRLKERLGHGGQQLSGGEQPLIARDIWRICSLIKDSGISAIIVDKNWKHVTQITGRNIILVKGQVVFEGSSQALLDDPSVLAQYLGV
jgi:branched-chain amino acid transport system ATP-binding protein